MEQKKNICLYVLKILKEHSSEKHQLTQNDILNYLKDYDITCDRKTISRSLDYLTEYGYTIIRKSGGGCYFVNDIFDVSEMTFLIDCIFSSPSIAQKQAESIIDRLTDEYCIFDKNKYKNIFKSNELIRTDNKQIFYSIDRINYAIDNDKQISFSYNLYDKNKKLVPRTDKKYIINPYFMVNSKGKYFLVCNKDNYDALSNYRIDYITDIEVLDTPRKPIKNVSKDVVNPVKYANEHIYMFDGGAKPFKLKLYNERMINEIIDWFGKDVRFIEENGSLFAIIKSNEKALIYWALQYGEQVSIEEPIETKAKITEIIEGMLKKYRE